MKINAFISRNLGIILLASAASGLFIRSTDFDSSLVIIVSLAAIIFASFFQIQLNKDLLMKDVRSSLVYFALRFAVMPVIVYYLTAPISEFYAVCGLVLLLLPAAVSAPAFTTMFGGNAALSLKLLVLTSFLSIAAIPLIVQMVLGKVEIEAGRMTVAMMYVIVAPFILHLPFRGNLKIRNAITGNIPLITAVGLAVIFIVSTSKNREIILGNPEIMLVYAIISLLIYLFLYAAGYFLMKGKPAADRIAYSVCSGANNIGLGVTLTALFFPSEMNVFFIVSQLAWIFVLIPVRRLFYMVDKRMK